MKKSSLVALIFFVLIQVFGDRASAAVPSTGYPPVSADAAILMDLNTGQVLYAKNPFKKRPPASTTKVMTTLLALETTDIRQQVTVSREAARTEGSSMYLSEGQILPLSDLLYGALLRSGNDACEAIAEHVAGNIDNFAALMNIKALALGALNTHFANPHGLPDDKHYSCAYDLAIVAREAMTNRVFAEIVSTKTASIDQPGEDWDRRLKNTNRLLWQYLWAEGVKTGTTNAAGPCLISAAAKDNRKLLAVVLSSSNRWNDSITLFEYGFKQFEYLQVAVKGSKYGTYRIAGGDNETVDLVYTKDLGVLVPSEEREAVEKRVSIDPYPQAPVSKGQVLGSVSYFVGSSYAGQVDLAAGTDVKPEGFWSKLGRQLKQLIIRQIST